MTSGMEIVDDRVHCAVIVDADPRRLGHRVIAAETDEGVAIVDETPQLAVIPVHAQDDRPIREVEPAGSVGEDAAPRSEERRVGKEWRREGSPCELTELW